MNFIFASFDSATTNQAAESSNNINTIIWLFGFPLILFVLYRLVFGHKNKKSKKSDTTSNSDSNYKCVSDTVYDFSPSTIWDSVPRPETSSVIDKYSYWPKRYMMTKRENEFFVRLNKIFETKCYVVPQVMLSSLFNAKRGGQSTMGAWAHINRKSVDYALLSKKDLSIICAIELDDYTHDREKRKARDEEVERIFRETKLPLIRFRDISKLSDQDILKHIVDEYNNCLK